MDNDLKKLFSSWGEVKSARVVTDDFTRRSRGFAFVEITEEADAMKAIEKLNNTSFMQKTIIVRAAKAKEDNGTTKKPIL